MASKKKEADGRVFRWSTQRATRSARPTFVPVGAGQSLPIFAWDPSANFEQWGMLLQTVGTSLAGGVAAALRAFCGGSPSSRGRRMFAVDALFRAKWRRISSASRPS